LQILFFKQLTFSVPRLAQFINTTENLRFDNAAIRFKDTEFDVQMFSREADKYAFGVTVDSWHLDWQPEVSSGVAQICNALGKVLFAVERLTLRHEVHSRSSEESN